MLKAGGSRAICRYASRPSRNVHALNAVAFSNVPMSLRCTECQKKYVELVARLGGAL